MSYDDRNFFLPAVSYTHPHGNAKGTEVLDVIFKVCNVLTAHVRSPPCPARDCVCEPQATCSDAATAWGGFRRVPDAAVLGAAGFRRVPDAAVLGAAAGAQRG